MTKKLPLIYFYLPQSDWPDSNMLESPDTYREVYKSCRSTGTYNWILQTYLRLKADGFGCELVGTMPTEGIVITGLSSVPANFQPGQKLLMVVPYGDKKPHPYAQLHVVQNPQGILVPYRLLGDRYLLPGENYYIPHWPQPGLIPRNPARGDRFENVAYIGREINLAPELRDQSWQEQLNSLGLRWHLISSPDRWNDYSDIDAIVAVRSFNHKVGYDWKPASKLYNSWHAGIPAILGCESAYRFERKNQLDYIEVTSLNEAIEALKRLRDDKELFHAMVANGRVRAEETQPEKLVEQWRTFVTDVAIPAYESWCNASNLTRKIFLTRRDLAIKTKGMRKSLQQVRNSVGIRTRIRSAISKVRGA